MAVEQLTKFQYQALDRSGTVRTGRFRADSVESATAYLRKHNLKPLDIVEADSGWNRDGFRRGKKATLDDVAAFFRQMATMVGAGITVLEGLRALESDTTNEGLQEAINGVRRSLEEGKPLADGFAAFPDVFPDVTVAVTRAAGQGDLREAFADLANNLERESELRKKIKAALIMPGILLTMSILLIIAMMTFVIPKFSDMYSQLGGDLPQATQMMMAVSNSAPIWVPVLIAIVAGCMLYYRARRHDPAFRARLDTVKIRLPLVGPLVAQIAVGRFARNFSTLLSSGVTTLDALSASRDTSGNVVVSRALLEVESELRDSRLRSSERGGANSALSEAMLHHPVFPRMLVVLIATGERSARLPELLKHASTHFEKDVERSAETMSNLINPLCMILVGVVVLITAICLYLPIVNIYKFVG